MSLKKIIAGTAIGGAIIGGITYLVRLKRTGAELESVVRAKIHKLDLTGLYVRLDVELKNPTATKFSIKFPFIKLVYKDATVGTSKAVDRDINIPAYGEAVADQIMINIPVVSIFSLGAGLLKDLAAGKSITMTAKTITTIDLGWKKVPYEKADEITLKK